MSANRTIYVIVILFLHSISNGQTTRFLKVGDKAPPIKVYKWIKGKPVIRFEKGKVYVIEFGATWCIPCAAAIPHLTELSKKYQGEINVVGIFVMEYKKDINDVSYVKRVEQYVKKQSAKMDYSVAIDASKKTMENSWLKAADKISIPTTFIVDKNGMIAWIGGGNPQQLDQALEIVNSDTYKIEEAIESSKMEKSLETSMIDPLKPLYVDGNGGDGNFFLFRSILTKYDGEKSRGITDFVYSRSWAKISADEQSYEGMVQQIGAPLEKLYYLAYADTIPNWVPTRHVDRTDNYPDTVKYPTLRSSYGNYWYKPILEVSDTSPFAFDIKVQSFRNKYNYSLIIPDKKANARFLQGAMQRDLKSFFGYEVTVEKRMMPCWKLIATEESRKLLSTKTPGNKYTESRLNDTLFQFTNAVMKDILIRFILNFSFGNSSYGYPPVEEAPFTDETGITGEVDFNISQHEFGEMNNKNFEVGLKFLQRFGLNLVKGLRETKVVIVRDPK